MDAAAPREVGERWLAAMRAGDWEAAWRQTDRIELPRRQAQRSDARFRREPHQLVWDGTSFEGRSVLVRCEHGLGDTLQFLRFVPSLQRQARELHLMVQPPLLGLLHDGPGLGRVQDGWCGVERWPRCEVEVEVMELAYALRATPASVPPPYPHLSDLARSRCRLELPGGNRLRVGLLWTASEWDTSRSVPLGMLAPLFDVAGVQFHSLQQGPAAEDPRLPRWGVEPLSERTATIEAAAAALLQLDLVLCVDAMLAHLAGTLGRPTWLLLKHDADWRWGSAGNATPWYPTLRLFRQAQPGNWESLIAQVADALRQAAASPTAGRATCLPTGPVARATVAG